MADQENAAGPKDPERAAAPDARRRLARIVLVAFLAAFTWLRIMIFLIMDRRLPDMFVHIKGTHVHHLNFGIFLLAVLGGYLLFGRPQGRRMKIAAGLYGLGLALTFDEFGMWLHLGGGYWQRANFDAITVIAGSLALLAFLPPVRELRGRHAIAAVILLALGTVFFVLLLRTVNRYGNELGPRPAGRGGLQSQSKAASGTAARSTRAIAPLTQTARQMPQP